MKIYISGAITDCPNYTEKFKNAEYYLQTLYPDCEIINPSLMGLVMPKSTTHEEYMIISFALLDMADTVYMLNNWRKSCGASQEYGYARAKGKIIMYEG